MDSAAEKAYHAMGESQTGLGVPRQKWLKHGHNKSAFMAPPSSAWTASFASAQRLFLGRRRSITLFALLLVGGTSVIYILSQPLSGQKIPPSEHSMTHSAQSHLAKDSPLKAVKASQFDPVNSFRGPPTALYKGPAFITKILLDADLVEYRQSPV